MNEEVKCPGKPTLEVDSFDARVIVYFGPCKESSSASTNDSVIKHSLGAESISISTANPDIVITIVEYLSYFGTPINRDARSAASTELNVRAVRAPASPTAMRDAK